MGDDTKDELSSITLRPLDLSDADDFMVWVGDDKVTHFCSFETYKNKEDAIAYIQTTVKSHPYFRAICLDNRPIGAISVTENFGGDKCRGELGYVLGSKYWGKGIATKAVKLVTQEIFSERSDLERLEALVDVENVGSQKVLLKAGFLREGLLRKYVVMKGITRDMVMFSFLSSDLIV